MKQSCSAQSKQPRAKRVKKPKHRVVARTFDFPMEVNAKQDGKIWMHIGACWRLRNILVADRVENRVANKLLKQQGVTEGLHYLSQSDQYTAIHEYVRHDTALLKVHSQVRQNVAVRVDEGYKRFFEALKEGRTNVNPPKFIERKKYRSITYPQYGPAAKIKNGKLYLSGIGEFQLFDYRKVKGKPKTVTIKFKQGRWHCIITTEAQEKDVLDMIRPDDPRQDAGFDTGLTALLTDSEGNEYDPPKAWYDYRARLRTGQKKMSRQFEEREKQYKILAAHAKAEGRQVSPLKDIPYSNRLKAQIKVVAKLHTKVENIRDHHHKKNASVIANRYRNAAVEEHGVQFMIRNRKLAKIASDRAIHKQKLLLKSKMGKRYIATPNQTEAGGNSQTCTCSAPVPKELKDRIHHCPVCGLTAGRDHVAANIVSIIAFGIASLTLGVGSHSPETGQVFVRRGEDKSLCGESRQCESESIPASESSRKRQPSQALRRSTTGAEATVGGKTRVHLQSTGVAT
jgi:putative transposase